MSSSSDYYDSSDSSPNYYNSSDSSPEIPRRKKSPVKRSKKKSPSRFSKKNESSSDSSGFSSDSSPEIPRRKKSPVKRSEKKSPPVFSKKRRFPMKNRTEKIFFLSRYGKVKDVDSLEDNSYFLEGKEIKSKKCLLKQEPDDETKKELWGKLPPEIIALIFSHVEIGESRPFKRCLEMLLFIGMFRENAQYYNEAFISLDVIYQRINAFYSIESLPRDRNYIPFSASEISNFGREESAGIKFLISNGSLKLTWSDENLDFRLPCGKFFVPFQKDSSFCFRHFDSEEFPLLDEKNFFYFRYFTYVLDYSTPGIWDSYFASARHDTNFVEFILKIPLDFRKIFVDVLFYRLFSPGLHGDATQMYLSKFRETFSFDKDMEKIFRCGFRNYDKKNLYEMFAEYFGKYLREEDVFDIENITKRKPIRFWYDRDFESIEFGILRKRLKFLNNFLMGEETDLIDIPDKSVFCYAPVNFASRPCYSFETCDLPDPESSLDSDNEERHSLKYLKTIPKYVLTVEGFKKREKEAFVLLRKFMKSFFS